jgi:glycosyltransferase involved in cell wall biosynthesis
MDIVKGLVTVVIPARNEPYLKKTIEGLLSQSSGSIEVIINLDGYWPPAGEIIDDPRVIYIHRGEAKGMRGGINSCVAIARGEYIMKTDAHCMFDKGFDEVLKANCEDNWIIVPRRYPLDPEKWATEERRDNKYPVDYMYLSSELHGEPWPERRDDPEHKDLMIDDLMSAQGSCWFMKNDYFNELELLDEESYGIFYNEFQEIGLKCWLSGGEIKVNKNTWYAHWHKPSDVGRGYHLEKGEQEKALEYLEKWKDGTGWHKQIHPLSWLVEKFGPVPTWEDNE